MVSSIAIALISNNPNAIAVGPAIMQQQNLRYSRLFEKEADRVGFINLVNAGYNPNSMGEMFENMNDLRRLSGDLPPEFLLTHPLSSSRISDAFNAAENISEEGTKQDSLEFSLMKARLEIYYENIPANALRLFESKYAENPSDANLYGLALAYISDDNAAAAETTSWGINGTYSFDLASVSVGYETQETSGTDSTGYFVGLTFPEVGPGSVSVGAATAGNFADSATEYMTYEASYSYPVNDGLTITPGVYIKETSGDDLTGILVKSSFSF